MNKLSVIQDLGNHLTPQTCGVLWFTQIPLIERPLPFSELDYYLDGLLTNICLEKRESPEHKHFLTTHHFGRPFFLAQFQMDGNNSKIKNDLGQVHQLALKLRGERGELVVIGEHLDRIRADLKIFNKDFELDFLSL